MNTDEPFHIKRLAIIGCGLMGGSVALALKRAGCVDHVVGYSRQASTRETALRLGVIDEAAAGVATAVRDAEVVLLATPVGALASTLQVIAPHLSSECVLTDVGSTKSDVAAIGKTHLGRHAARFVPAHPIAGKEHAGVEHAEADLYDERKVILTPQPHNALGAIAKVQSMWQVCGGDVISMPAQSHDQVFAAVSHLPHLLAFSYINGLANQSESDLFFALAGPGFRDFTRIAGANPEMWRDVFKSNREAIQEQIDQFRGALNQFEKALAAQDSGALEAFVARSRELRAPWRLNAAIPTRDDLTQQ